MLSSSGSSSRVTEFAVWGEGMQKPPLPCVTEMSKEGLGFCVCSVLHQAWWLGEGNRDQPDLGPVPILVAGGHSGYFKMNGPMSTRKSELGDSQRKTEQCEEFKCDGKKILSWHNFSYNNKTLKRKPHDLWKNQNIVQRRTVRWGRVA